MKAEAKINPVPNRLTTLLFIIYLILLGWILLFKLGVRFPYVGTRSVNLTPFRQHHLSGENILNVIVFIPLGIYVGTLFQRWSLGAKLLFIFMLSLMVEGLQYILRIGISDITDLITNTSGGIFGLIIFKAIDLIFNNRVRAHKFVNIMATLGTSFIILLLVLLKMNMLPIRYQ